jgi:hypothetical protein
MSEATSGGGSASPGIDEDPEVLVTESDVLADNMALMYQDAAEHTPAHAGSAPQNGAASGAASVSSSSPPPPPPPPKKTPPPPSPPPPEQELPCGCRPGPGQSKRCEAWYLLECTTECKKCKQTNRYGMECFSSYDGFKSHAAGDLHWAGILDNVELQPLMDALEAMQGQTYLESSSDDTEKTFNLDNPVAKDKDETVRQLVAKCLKIEQWAPAELRRLAASGKLVPNNMAAIRVWSSEDAQVFSKTSVPILARHA